MKKTDLRDILQAVEQTRQERCRDLSAEFVEAVIRAEEANPEDDETAMKTIEAALNATLAKQEKR
jgi:hypothetical protein